MTDSDRRQLTILTLGGFALVFAAIVATGCTPVSPHPASEQVVAEEASAEAIDASDEPVIEPVTDPPDPLEPAEEAGKCHCCETCTCGDRCICIMGEPCSKDCTCCPPENVKQAKPRKPWGGVPLYPTPFWCPACRDFSYWLAPMHCKKTECKHCKRFTAIRTEFEYQRQQRLGFFRGAMMGSGGGGGC